MQKGLQPPVLVFVQTKERAQELFKELLYDSIHVDVIHSERLGGDFSSFLTEKMLIIEYLHALSYS